MWLLLLEEVAEVVDVEVRVVVVVVVIAAAVVVVIASHRRGVGDDGRNGNKNWY